MSEGADWNTVSKHRKENVGQMANGGGRDLRREKVAGALGQRRKQDSRGTPRPQPSVSFLPEPRAGCGLLLLVNTLGKI